MGGGVGNRVMRRLTGRGKGQSRMDFYFADKVTPSVPVLFSRHPPQTCHFCFPPSSGPGTANPVQRMAGRHGVCSV